MAIEILETEETLKDYADSLEASKGSLVSWVEAHLNDWENYYESNYKEKDDEYYRIWRGIWAKEDVQRQSERSRIVSPNTMQAVESGVAEVEEAIFGQGKFFRLDDNVGDQQKADVALLEKLLTEKFKKTKMRSAVAECILNSAIYGYAAAEVVVEQKTYRAPAVQDTMGGLQSFGVEETEEVCVTLRPIQTKNLRFDPTATCIQSGLGFGIDEFVPRHQVEELMEQGVYRDVYLGDAPPDQDIEPSKELVQYPEGDRVRQKKYFGKVPRVLLEAAQRESEDEEMVNILGEPEGSDGSLYVEAIIVIGNGRLLKAEENPYLMSDRPVVGFSWEEVPGLFRGRGIVEKGYNTQKAIDAEMRSRIDGLALTTHPMLAMDARRMPRNSDFRVRPGKTIMTQGDPREILHSFNFGEMSQNTYAQTASLERMHQSATGSVDSSGIAGGINGEATAAGISMSLGAIIKRHKRTLVSFQDSFLIPLVEKAAWRYMQYSPEEFPIGDYDFLASSSLGIMAREYEVSQLVQLLQTTAPDDPLRPVIMEQVVENMNLAERQGFLERLREASTPTPEQQEAQRLAQDLQQRRTQAEIDVLKGQANEFNSRARKYAAEAQSQPQLALGELNLKQSKDSFEREFKLADLDLKKKTQFFKQELDLANFQLDKEELTHKITNDSNINKLKALEIDTSKPEPEKPDLVFDSSTGGFIES